MPKAIGVQFISGIKAYDFSPGIFDIKVRDQVLVETTQGKEVGKVLYVGKEINEKKLESPLKEVIKVLSEEEIKEQAALKKKASEEIASVSKIIAKLGVPMRLIALEYNIYEDRADIYFASEGRVDFRNAVKELSKSLNKTVRLRQVGSRDQAKMLGGFGPCGRETCCKTFLTSPTGVSKDEASRITNGKNINKTLGICGNIMCCLKYGAAPAQRNHAAEPKRSEKNTGKSGKIFKKKA